MSPSHAKNCEELATFAFFSHPLIVAPPPHAILIFSPRLSTLFRPSNLPRCTYTPSSVFFFFQLPFVSKNASVFFPHPWPHYISAPKFKSSFVFSFPSITLPPLLASLRTIVGLFFFFPPPSQSVYYSSVSTRYFFERRFPLRISPSPLNAFRSLKDFVLSLPCVASDFYFFFSPSTPFYALNCHLFFSRLKLFRSDDFCPDAPCAPLLFPLLRVFFNSAFLVAPSNAGRIFPSADRAFLVFCIPFFSVFTPYGCKEASRFSCFLNADRPFSFHIFSNPLLASHFHSVLLVCSFPTIFFFARRQVAS